MMNFTKFVDWPGQTGTTLTLCILGEDPFGDALDAVEGKVVKGGRLAVKRIRAREAVEGCHILFIARSERSQLGQILGALTGRPVLTVADMEDFAEAGGMINLITVEDKVRFKVNAEAAQRAGLQISSKLLSLGRIVQGRGD